MGRRGFTVAEMMIVCVLLASLVLGAFLSGRKGVEQADTRAMADVISATLRAARQQAVTEGEPVALVLPSDGGTRPHTQGYAVIAGYSPTLREVKSFASEHPVSCFAVGIIGPGSQVTRPELALVGQEFDFTAWLTASTWQDDFVFCFLPDGSLVTNDLPLRNGRYEILVSTGLRYSTTGAPSGSGWGVPAPYFQLAEGSATRVVAITPLGEVAIHRDAPTVTQRERLDFQEAPAALPVPAAATQVPPNLANIEIFPVPDPNSLPPGIEALVDVKEHLSLKVTAEDSDPERRLYCRWTSDNGGPFSRPEAHPMIWEDGSWVSRVEWRPPPGATGGEIFELNAEVSDPQGGTDTDALGATGRVQTVQRSKILFHSQRNGGNGLYTMLGDGSDVTFLFPGSNGVLSPAGDQVFYARGNTLFLRPIGSDTEVTLITMPQEAIIEPSTGATIMASVKPECMNARGDLLFWTIGNSAYVAEFNGFSEVVPYRLNGDPGFVDAHSGERSVELVISPSGEHVAYDDGFYLYVAEFDQEGPPYITGGNQNLVNAFWGGEAAGNASWSHDGRRLMFHGNRGGSGMLDIGSFDFDPATGTASGMNWITNDPEQDNLISVSPDGSQYVFCKEAGGDWDIIRANADNSNMINLTADNPGDDLYPVWGR